MMTTAKEVQRKRLLIADDNPLMQEVIDRVLTSFYPQLDILLAQNGQEAVNAATTNRPDLILLAAVEAYLRLDLSWSQP